MTTKRMASIVQLRNVLTVGEQDRNSHFFVSQRTGQSSYFAYNCLCFCNIEVNKQKDQDCRWNVIYFPKQFYEQLPVQVFSWYRVKLFSNICLTYSCYLWFVIRAWVWAALVDRQDLLHKSPEVLYRSYRLCSEHFSSNRFTSAARMRLKRNALPTALCNTVAECTQQPTQGSPKRKRMKVSQCDPGKVILLIAVHAYIWFK